MMGLRRGFPEYYYLKKTIKQQQHNFLRLQHRQERLLRAVVESAFDHVPFYREIARERGLTSTDIRTMADLKKLPVISKMQVCEAYAKKTIVNKNHIKNSREYTTSGSSGFRLTVLCDSQSYGYYTRQGRRSFREQGVRMTDRLAYFWYEPRWKKNIWEYINLFKKQVILYTEDEITQLEKLKELDPTVIYGPPSTIMSLSYLLGRTDIHLAPRLIITQSELLTEEMRGRIEEKFRASVLDQYRSHEFSYIAWQCPEYKNYHINADSVIMEILDGKGQEVPVGERGRIVLTGLVNKVMPLLRYDIGDSGAREKELCPCGRSLPLLRSLEGRSDDFIVTPEGSLLSPRRIGGMMEHFHTIKEYRFIQEDINLFVLKIVPSASYSAQEEMRLRDNVQRIVGKDGIVQIEHVPTILQASPRKIKVIESKVKKR